MPVEYIKRLSELAAKRGRPAFQWVISESAPLTPLRKPLSECRVALVTSGGVYHVSQPEYQDADDLTWRELPKDVPLAELRIHHVGYNHADADRDVNVVFPISRMRELEDQGVIKELASPCFTFMGRIYSRLRLVKETGPALAARMKEMGVDACLLAPA